ncbi:unnamed protein product [Lactuca saligna]|uniref:Uncharacterized protein n=1 Tax=Lactuca saligna TaxID=75948 RepID=A0AA36E7U3_LACSI|nr:unnamed protein product [Lactuca saligna]
MLASSSSTRMQTKQQGTTMNALPSQINEKIVAMVGGKSPINASEADKGQLDAIFILGMLFIAEGSERKQDALIMLNSSYINTKIKLEYERNLLQGSKPLGYGKEIKADTIPWLA